MFDKEKMFEKKENKHLSKEQSLRLGNLKPLKCRSSHDIFNRVLSKAPQKMFFTILLNM